jgi:hypothetical protein
LSVAAFSEAVRTVASSKPAVPRRLDLDRHVQRHARNDDAERAKHLLGELLEVRRVALGLKALAADEPRPDRDAGPRPDSGLMPGCVPDLLGAAWRWLGRQIVALRLCPFGAHDRRRVGRCHLDPSGVL